MTLEPHIREIYPNREEIEDLISRILSVGPEQTEDDLKYLYSSNGIREFEYLTRAYYNSLNEAISQSYFRLKYCLFV